MFSFLFLKVNFRNYHKLVIYLKWCQDILLFEKQNITISDSLMLRVIKTKALLSPSLCQKQNCVSSITSWLNASLGKVCFNLHLCCQGQNMATCYSESCLVSCCMIRNNCSFWICTSFIHPFCNNLSSD